MTNRITEEQIYEEAKKRVKDKKEFYGNLGSWASVNTVLVIIWALTDAGGYPWFLWPLCIWGVFVLVHFLRIFVFARRTDISAIEKEAEKIRRDEHQPK
ncbi:MAG TPA: 2TM domain-containing protein [Dehalococcoidia bacterium]|nr:2TM domain-containing protein [Dehalococcoidia bacterium]